MSDVYVLRDLSGVAEVERLLDAAQARPNPNWCDEYDQAKALAQTVSLRHFGFDEAGTHHVDDPYASRERNEAAWASREPFFEEGPQSEGAPGKVLTDFEKFGWDVSDGAGGVLRCLHLFRRQIIAAEYDIAGHLPDEEPDLTEDQAANIEAKLQAEAASFRPSKGASRE